MRRLLVTAITASTFLFGGMHIVDAQTATNAVAPPPATEIGKSNQTATVDDINIPYEIIFFIEEKYPGHAVMQASKVIHNGSAAYRLRIDRDDIVRPNEGTLLLFDANWAFVSDQKLIAPPEPKKEDIKPQTRTHSAPAPAPKPKPEQTVPRGNGGGRGSGGVSSPTQDTVVQPGEENATEGTAEDSSEETTTEPEADPTTTQAT